MSQGLPFVNSRMLFREREDAIWRIRRRVERHWSRMKSVSPAMRKYFAERDIRAAMIAAGLPLPVALSFDELVRRYVIFGRRDRKLLKRLDPKLKAAVVAILDAEVS